MSTTRPIRLLQQAILPLILITVIAPGRGEFPAWANERAAGAVAARPVARQSPGRLTDYVNPFIGTGGHGHTYPGPSLPFGMIQPGPDTRLTGWDGSSGYHYSDTRIFGFSHTHLSGTGIPDYGDVLLAPIAGTVRLNNGADGRAGYSSTFSHDEERASPGYYAVTLKDDGIRAELTTTARAGMHRYAFPAGRPAHVILDLEHRDELTEAGIDVRGEREVVGIRRSRSWARDQVIYYVIRFSRPFLSTRFVAGDRLRSGQRGARVKAAFSFGAVAEPLVVKVGISAVSVDGARKNLDQELPGWDFDAVRRAAGDAWERELAKIRVSGGTRDERIRFYTALYHSMLAPNVYMDVDGRYRGRDGRIHVAEGFTYYTVFSLWDTFRALHPLLAIVDPARTRDFILTFLRQYRDAGRLPVWELAANETDTMIGYHAVPVIADAIAKGIDGFDRWLAFDAMIHSADEDRFGLAAYQRSGFIDAAEEAESVSRTLEYAYDDWAIAQVARRLGRTAEYVRFIRRAQGYKHLYDPATGFMRARVEGMWMSPFHPSEVNSHYTEANAWQYSFFVPQDVEGLMRLMGGPAAFARRLDALFSASSRTTGRDQADITGLIGQYAHGNEPSHHMAYLYAYAGEPWKTQAMVRRIVDTLYGSGPDGLAGNEDCGQMSAWYVFSALGFYPVTPGSTQYVIGSPVFDRATISVAGDRAFVVRAQGSSSPKAHYIRSARLNGAEYDRSFIDHADLMRGGELMFEMSDAPNVAWGSAPASRPRSSIHEESIVAAPFVSGGTRVFRGTQQVALGSADAGVEIRYTLDGRSPDKTSNRYDLPIRVDASATLRARAFRDEEASPVLTVVFRRLDDYPRIALSAAYAPQYAAAGDDALIDGLRGGSNFRTGRWQGYQGQNLDVTVDFGAPRDITSVAMGFLQDTGSWIFMPRRIEVAVSHDGRTFEVLGAVENTVSERDEQAVTRDFELYAAARARYVRISVARYGTLPAWHPGAGGEAWFFADEIVVR
jgi:predicted alpha-1,2-mannosidase